MNKNFLMKKRLKNIRENKKLSRPQVFKDTGIPIDTLSGWEMDKYLPRIDQLVILADYYNVSLDYITCRTDNPEVNKETPKDHPKINK